MATPFEQLERGQLFLNKQVNKLGDYFADKGMPVVGDFIDPTKDRDKKGGILKKDAEGKTYYEPGTGFPDKFMYGSVPMGTFGSGISKKEAREKFFREKFIHDMQKDNQLGDIAMAGYSPLIPEPLRDKYKKEADIDKYLKNIERLRKRGLV